MQGVSESILVEHALGPAVVIVKIGGDGRESRARTAIVRHLLRLEIAECRPRFCRRRRPELVIHHDGLSRLDRLLKLA